MKQMPHVLNIHIQRNIYCFTSFFKSLNHFIHILKKWRRIGKTYEFQHVRLCDSLAKTLVNRFTFAGDHSSMFEEGSLVYTCSWLQEIPSLDCCLWSLYHTCTFHPRRLVLVVPFWMTLVYEQKVSCFNVWPSVGPNIVLNNKMIDSLNMWDVTEEKSKIDFVLCFSSKNFAWNMDLLKK